MALFGKPSADKILAKGAPIGGRIVGIEVTYTSDGDSIRRVDEYAVTLDDGQTLGVRQRLIPDDVVRLGMAVRVIALEDAVVIDWAATGAEAGFDGTTDDWRHKALKDAPPAGIIDRLDELETARKKGEPATLEITGLNEKSVLGGLASALHATATIRLEGVEPYEAEVKVDGVPGYASHLLRTGVSLPALVRVKRLDKPVIDWPSAAMASPGLDEPPARPRTATPTEVMGTPEDGGASVVESIAAAADSGDLIAGIDVATYAAIEAGLQRDRVPPAEHDAYAVARGVPPGTTYATVTAAWQAAIRADWKVGAAFGEAFEAASKKR